MKFGIAGITSNKLNTVGAVRVQFQRFDAGKFVKGNISKSFTIDDTTVTECDDLIRKLLLAHFEKQTAAAAKAEAKAAKERLAAQPAGAKAMGTKAAK